MSSLGELAGRVHVRALTEDEAFLLAALHLQALRRRGVDPSGSGPAGHVQELGAAWAGRAADLPAWVAEHEDKHVGMALCRPPVLPHVGQGLPQLLLLEPLGAPGPEPVALALLRTVVDWAGRRGHPWIDVDVSVTLPAAVLDAVRAVTRTGHRLQVPTRP